MVQMQENPTSSNSQEESPESLIKPDDPIYKTCTTTTKEEETIRIQGRAIQILEQQKRENMKKGKLNEVYVISKSWYSKWKEYSLYAFIKRSIKRPEFYEKRPKPFKLKPESHPGKIDNSDLLVPISDFLNNQDVNDAKNLVISNEKVIKKDFKLISKPIWNMLVNYYGGGPAIVRNLKQEEGSTEFDIYHCKIQLVFIPTREVLTDKDYITHNVKMYTMYVNEFITLDDFNTEVNKIISMKENEALRLSLGITEYKAAIDFILYKLKKDVTYQDLVDLLINKLEDIKNGKTIRRINLRITK